MSEGATLAGRRAKRDAVLTRALAAFHRANYDTCIAVLDVGVYESASARARAEFLRARVARVLGDLETWERSAGYAARHCEIAGERAAAQVLLAIVARRLGSADADRYRADAEAEVVRVRGAASALATYLLATDAWEMRRYERADELAQRNIDNDLIVAESLAMRAYTAAKREKFREAATHFSNALRFVDRDEVDARARLGVALGALMVASDIADLRLAARARSVYAASPVPSSLDVFSYNFERGLRLVALLEGDLDAAFVAARKSAVLAPSPMFAAIGESHAAEIALLLGERGAFGVQLRLAWNAIRAADWSVADTEQLMALTTFALVAADAMPAEARKAIMIYQSIRPKANPGNSLEDDRRVFAYDLWAAARMNEMLGDRDRALALYRQSRDIWASVDYVVRAAQIALDIRRLDGGVEHRAILEALTRRAPKAWLRAKFEDRIPALSSLRAAQREVLARLLDGFSAKAIAGDLGRSHSTVINHTRKIFAAFGVHSRDELFRVCRDHGITSESIRSSL
jgi:DNA-binding CsgD family transcriptional regulator